MAETKEWVKVTHTPSGTLVAVTLQEGNLTVKWAVKAYVGFIKQGVVEARTGAQKVLTEIGDVDG